MNLDLCQIPKTRARRKDAGGGLGYLFARIRRELEERWAAVGADAGRALLVDFAGSDFNPGDAVALEQISCLEAPAVPPQMDFRAHAGGRVDGVIMCLQPAWLEFGAVLAAALRVLQPGGKLLFCTFGRDTLEQLRWAWRQVDELPHVHPFADMHTIGDQLLGSGFADPIVDVDRLAVEYENAAMLYKDLRREGFINLMQTRRKTLTGKDRFNGFCAALESLRAPRARLRITCELIYGVATAPRPSPRKVRVAPPTVRV